MGFQIKLALGIALSAALLAPASAVQAQWNEYDRRQQTKNEWRNIAIGSGILATIGLLKEDSTLTFAGAAGALYSAYRYEQDRKSQNRLRYMRSVYFSRPYFYRNGVRYDRRLVTRDGQRYYQFVRHDNGRHLGWYKGRGNPHRSNDVWNEKYRVWHSEVPWHPSARYVDSRSRSKGSSHSRSKSKSKSKSKGKGRGG